MPLTKDDKCIGLTLGGGSARGWAHIGVIRELEKMGIVPEIVCGSSIGALVGGAYASRTMDPLEDWLRKLDWQETLKYFDFSFRGGLIEGKKLFDFFLQHLTDHDISELPVIYSAVATNLETGSETWIQNGSLLEAIRASIALPGLFTPVYKDDSWLIDGALVNPVPVSLCRALGADIIIAVDLTANLVGHRFKDKDQNHEETPAYIKKLQTMWNNTINNNNQNKRETPGLFDTMSSALNIIQNELTRTQLAVNPPDIIITPDLSHIGLLEFYRANEAIDAGKASVAAIAPDLEKLLK